VPEVVESKREFEETEPPKPARIRRGSRRIWLGLAALILIGAGGYVYWRHAAVRESTDDAQIDGHLHPVSARVGGTVQRVLVRDNQYVEAGTVVVEIDPRDYRVALARAQGDLAEAQADLAESRTNVPIASTTTSSQLSSAEAGVGEARAAVATAEKQVDAAQARLTSAGARVREAQANYDKAAKDLARMKALVAKEEISQQQYDAAVASADALRAQVDSAHAQVQEAEQGVQVSRSVLEQQRARVARAEAEVRAARTAPEQVAASQARAQSSHAKVEQRQADLAQTQLNLEYTQVKAPVSGIISQRTVEVGQVVQAGQPLLAIVPLNDIWVTANFKENQLRHMRPGQPVDIHVDSTGKGYKGHVDSIAAATGSRFSLLPPENATGNYVKVVQRVPVKIVFEKDQDPDHVLRPGMSVAPTVRTE
jgi:membrane fusion protein (multidrug efflux system)